jgi:hydroxymethylglutaryl-CoA reductase
VKTARELAEVIVSVGLAQNLAALRALATEGIQRGHMRLHARQVAIAAGARGEAVEKVAERLVEEKAIRIDRAEELVRELR